MTKLQHFRVGKGGFTLAYYLLKKVDGEQLLYEIACCSRKDNFKRKIGRQVACGRLEKSPFMSNLKRGKMRHYEIIHQLFEELQDSSIIPRHYRKFMKEKLENFKQVQITREPVPITG